MAAKALTLEAAKTANLTLVEGHTGKQALHDVVTAYQANRRGGNANTKGRGDVRGSGKKLWKQKGTGNARMGSRRSPIWVGGGVAWGPKTRDWSKTTTKGARKLALRTALTARIKDGDILTADSLTIKDGRTKSFIATVSGIAAIEKKVLIVGNFDEMTFRAGRNVQKVQLISADDLNAENLLGYSKIIFTGDTLETLARRTA